MRLLQGMTRSKSDNNGCSVMFQTAACKQRHPGNWRNAGSTIEILYAARTERANLFYVLHLAQGTDMRAKQNAHISVNNLQLQPPCTKCPQIWPKNLDGQINSRLYVVRESGPGWNTSDRSALYRPRGGKGALQE